MSSTRPFAPVTEAALARAREDPAFRRQLLAQNLDLLLSYLQKQRTTYGSAHASAQEMREGVALAVRLAEMIQTVGTPARRS